MEVGTDPVPQPELMNLTAGADLARWLAVLRPDLDLFLVLVGTHYHEAILSQD